MYYSEDDLFGMWEEINEVLRAMAEVYNWVDIQGTTDKLWFACEKLDAVRKTCPQYFDEYGEYAEDAISMFFSKRYMKYAMENAWCD